MIRYTASPLTRPTKIVKKIRCGCAEQVENLKTIAKFLFQWYFVKQENVCIVETRNNAHTRAARLQLILFSKDIGAF
jgi:hypothetical protein